MASPASHHSTHVNKLQERTNIPQEAESNPHHVVRHGQKDQITGFKNPYPSYKAPQVWAHVIKPRLTGKLKFPDTKPPNVPVVKPEWLPSRFTLQSADRIRATWLGHACYYVEFPSGLRVLFDPVFEPCCSPWPANYFGPRRYTPVPCNIDQLPEVDAVVISHSHYDHLSSYSLLDIKGRFPNVHFFVGLGLEKWFRDRGFDHVTEMDWWQDADLTVKVNSEADGERSLTARVSCLPSQHNSARGLFDRDQTLWCSWAIYSGGRSVWFGGDTGYRAVPKVGDGVDDYGPEYAHLPRCPQFKQIGDLRGPFDLGLIPIGAYAPRAAFSGMHANPFDSVEIFLDTKCRRAMGIHWGTWALTTEEVLEPPALLKEALTRYKLPEEGLFDVCDIGESRHFSKDDTTHQQLLEEVYSGR